MLVADVCLMRVAWLHDAVHVNLDILRVHLRSDVLEPVLVVRFQVDGVVTEYHLPVSVPHTVYLANDYRGYVTACPCGVEAVTSKYLAVEAQLEAIGAYLGRIPCHLAVHAVIVGRGLPVDDIRRSILMQNHKVDGACQSYLLGIPRHEIRDIHLLVLIGYSVFGEDGEVLFVALFQPGTSTQLHVPALRYFEDGARVLVADKGIRNALHPLSAHQLDLARIVEIGRGIEVVAYHLHECVEPGLLACYRVGVTGANKAYRRGLVTLAVVPLGYAGEITLQQVVYRITIFRLVFPFALYDRSVLLHELLFRQGLAYLLCVIRVAEQYLNVRWVPEGVFARHITRRQLRIQPVEVIVLHELRS